MGGIAEQRRPAEGPAGQWVAIDHRIEIRLRRGVDDRGHVQPPEVPVLELRQEILERSGSVPVLLRGQSRAGPPELRDEVEALPPVCTVSYWVPDELLIGMADPDHRS